LKRHGNEIEYQSGDILGNGITFIEEVAPREAMRNSTSKHTIKFRKAKFRCFCGKTFITEIGVVKTQRTKSCGCLQKETVKKYHEKKAREKRENSLKGASNEL
jgi:hypothetical protein